MKCGCIQQLTVAVVLFLNRPTSLHFLSIHNSPVCNILSMNVAHINNNFPINRFFFRLARRGVGGGGGGRSFDWFPDIFSLRKENLLPGSLHRSNGRSLRCQSEIQVIQVFRSLQTRRVHVLPSGYGISNSQQRTIFSFHNSKKNKTKTFLQSPCNYSNWHVIQHGIAVGLVSLL